MGTLIALFRQRWEMLDMDIFLSETLEVCKYSVLPGRDMDPSLRQLS